MNFYFEFQYFHCHIKTLTIMKRKRIFFGKYRYEYNIITLSQHHFETFRRCFHLLKNFHRFLFCFFTFCSPPFLLFNRCLAVNKNVKKFSIPSLIITLVWHDGAMLKCLKENVYETIKPVNCNITSPPAANKRNSN